MGTHSGGSPGGVTYPIELAVWFPKQGINTKEKMTMKIGLTYDLRSDYLAAGFAEEETAEFDREETIEGIKDGSIATK